MGTAEASRWRAEQKEMKAEFGMRQAQTRQSRNAELDKYRILITTEEGHGKARKMK